MRYSDEVLRCLRFICLVSCVNKVIIMSYLCQNGSLASMQSETLPHPKRIKHHTRISFLLLVILIGYLVSLLLIITPGDNLCKSELNSTHQTAELLGSEVQFISERFCQCFESEGKVWHALPYISVGLFGGVAFLFVWLSFVYKYNTKTDQVHVLFPIIFALLTWMFYFLLVHFTHRKLEKNKQLANYNEDVHFASTALFLFFYIMLWSTVFRQHIITEKHLKGLLRSIDLILLATLVICSLIFAIYAFDWANDRDGNNYKTAIIMEYIIFCVLVAQSVMCIAFTWVYWSEHEDEDNIIRTKSEDSLKDSPFRGAGCYQNHVKYVTLKTDILGKA